MLAGGQVGYWAPSYQFAQEPYKRIKRALPSRVVTSKSDNELRIELVTGGTLRCFSLESPDAGRSFDFDLALIDEAGLIACLEEAWNETIRYTLADRKGRARFGGTPKGRNYFYQLYLRALGGEPGWSYHTASTWQNPYIPKEELEAIKESTPDRAYRQEVLAEFLESGGGVFADVDRRVMTGVEKIPPQEGHVYHAGIDLAKSEDYTVVSILDQNGRQCLVERWNKRSWPDTVRMCGEILKAYNATATVDSTGVGDPVFDAMKRAGMSVVSFQFTQQSREHLLERLMLEMEQEKITLLDLPVQTAELKSFEWVLRGKTVRAEAPKHDDTVMALALAVQGATKPRFTYQVY
jgi:hypothetical protein